MRANIIVQDLPGQTITVTEKSTQLSISTSTVRDTITTTSTQLQLTTATDLTTIIGMSTVTRASPVAEVPSSVIRVATSFVVHNLTIFVARTQPITISSFATTVGECEVTTTLRNTLTEQITRTSLIGPFTLIRTTTARDFSTTTRFVASYSTITRTILTTIRASAATRVRAQMLTETKHVTATAIQKSVRTMTATIRSTITSVDLQTQTRSTTVIRPMTVTRHQPFTVTRQRVSTVTRQKFRVMTITRPARTITRTITTAAWVVPRQTISVTATRVSTVIRTITQQTQSSSANRLSGPLGRW